MNNETQAIDTTNDSLVALQGDRIRILRHVSDLSKPEALRLAAWLVAIADDEDEFSAVLDAVMST